jgi:hypothetical protein
MDSVGSGRGLIETLFRHLPGGLKNITKDVGQCGRYASDTRADPRWGLSQFRRCGSSRQWRGAVRVKASTNTGLPQ